MPVRYSRIVPVTALLALSLVVSGCNTREISRDWFSELGAGLDEGGFGSPTRNNIAVQTGERSYVSQLGNRFAEQVPTTINFAFNSTRLDAAAIDVLRRQADWIRQFPEVRFRVYGHTDKVGSDAYNRRLGRRRAEAVVAFFASQGISRDRLEALVSFGEDRPVVQTEGPEVRNRRTVTEVSGFVSRHPTVMNGKYAEIIFREYVVSAKPSPDINTEGVSGDGG